jgi:solute carrier family 23 (nucleobase transporter), member 1
MSSPGMIRPEEMNYGLEDVPRPIPKAIGLGVQHVLTMFGATVAVPLLLGPAMGIEGAELAILVSAVMIASGVATIIQVRFGTRLPIIQGVSFAFLGPFFAIIAATVGGQVTMQYIAGAIIAGAVLEIVIGYGRLFGLIRRFISPVVIGPVIALIGLALFQVGAPQAGQNWWLAGTVIAGAFLFSLILAPRVRFFSLFPILLAVLVAYALAAVLTVTGVYTPDHAGYVDFGGVAAAPWVRNIVGDFSIIFPWGLPQFSLGFILATLAGYLASMIESFGAYYAITRAAQGPALPGTLAPGHEEIGKAHRSAGNEIRAVPSEANCTHANPPKSRWSVLIVTTHPPIIPCEELQAIATLSS